MFSFSIDTLTLDEQNMINRIYHIIRNLKGSSYWASDTYHFYIDWVFKNDGVYLDKVHGNLGTNNKDVTISFCIKFNDKDIQVTGEFSSINENLDKVMKFMNVSDKVSQDFKITVKPISHVYNSRINGLMDKIWIAVTSNILNQRFNVGWYLDQNKNLNITSISGTDDYNKNFKIGFSGLSLCSGYFELNYENSKYVFTNCQNYGYFKGQGLYRTLGSSYYNSGGDEGCHMDTKHENDCIQLTTKIFNL